MSPPSQLRARAWLAAPAAAFLFLACVAIIRIRHVEYASWVAGGAGAALARGSGNPSLIIPGHRESSFEWLDETLQMLRHREWRIHHVDFENAPRGRAEAAGSPFRWWLALVAALGRLAGGQGLVASVEGAAIYGPPLLQLGLLAAATWAAWRFFGAAAAAAASLASVALYPLNGQFVAGVPDALGLSWMVAAAGLAALIVAARREGIHRRRAFVLSGVVGGIGLWINASIQMPFIAGAALGGWIALGLSALRRSDSPGIEGAHWRLWGLAGAGACLACYLLEYAPHPMASWDLGTNHPLHGVAWLGLSELLALSGSGRGVVGRWRIGGRALAGLVAVAAIPVTLHLVPGARFLSNGLDALRLTDAPESTEVANLGPLLMRADSGFATAALWVPLLLVPAALALLWRRSASPADGFGLALALGSIAVGLALAVKQVRWFAGADAALLVLVLPLVAAVAGSPAFRRLWWPFGIALGVMVVPGALLIWPAPVQTLDENDLVGIIERDLAGMLARRVGEESPVVLAPPNTTAGLYYYGGLRGLDTLDGQNAEGLGVAVRIAAALTPEEAQALLAERQVTYIVLPQWDTYFDLFAHLGQGETSEAFLGRLHNWVLPPWLRPVPYDMPTIPGFANQSVVIFEVVEEQDRAVAVSRVAEYFVDMGNGPMAENAAGALRRYPSDLGALLARTQVAAASGQSEEFARLSETVLRRVRSGGDRDLAWDQKLDLAVVLAQAHEAALAKSELERCVASVTEPDLRELSVNGLYRLQVLTNALGVEISDAHLRTLSLDLLPPDIRSQFRGQRAQ